MQSADLFRLLTLAALWGASFLFTRIIAPVLGPLWTAEARVAIAGAAMLLFMAVLRKPMAFRLHWRHYLVLGTINSALPFGLYSWAALTVPAGFSAILNATSPLWGALVGAALLGEKLTLRKLAGLVMGVLGVALLVRLGPMAFTPEVLLATLACAAAALCYALAGAYTKRSAAGIGAPQMATGSQLAAALVLLPALPLSPLRAEPTAWVLLMAVMLALLCSAVAYFIYFRLIADIGPTKALTVTFLIPLFALAWGAIFLGEEITGGTLAGCALVIAATWLVVRQPASVKDEPGRQRAA